MITLSLKEYVDVVHQGNKAEFARSFNRSPQGVSKMFRNPDKWLMVITKDEILITEIRGSISVAQG